MMIAPQARIHHEEIWRLKVSDNGVGNLTSPSSAEGVLGTAGVAARAKQLGGQISSVSDEGGVAVSLTGVLDDAGLPIAA